MSKSKRPTEHHSSTADAAEDDKSLGGNGGHEHVPRWPAVACGAAAAIGVAWAAAFVSVHGAERDVGVAAWVAAAVIGASATISAAVPRRTRRRTPSDEKTDLHS
jgi:hypothetical protein